MCHNLDMLTTLRATCTFQDGTSPRSTLCESLTFEQCLLNPPLRYQVRIILNRTNVFPWTILHSVHSYDYASRAYSSRFPKFFPKIISILTALTASTLPHLFSSPLSSLHAYTDAQAAQCHNDHTLRSLWTGRCKAEALFKLRWFSWYVVLANRTAMSL